MTEAERRPWSPTPRVADPLIAFLALLCLLLLLSMTQRPAPGKPSHALSLEGRTEEITLAGRALLPFAPQVRERAEPAAPADRAMRAVLAAEAGERERARRLALEGPAPGAIPAFALAWRAAYEDGPLPDRPARDAVAATLRHGYAARVLEARLDAREGRDPSPALAAARTWALRRLAVLAVAGLAALGLGVAGLVFGLVQSFTWRRAPRTEPPRWRMGGRALALVGLGWLLAFLLSSTAAAQLLAPFPTLKPLALPLAYLIHASAGLGLLLRAEGVSPRTLLRRLCPAAPRPHSLGWALGFWSLGVLAVFLVGLLFAPLLKDGNPAQRELLEQMGTLRGAAVLAAFLAVSVLAPLWEELLFRGLLLPWIGHRLSPSLRRAAWPVALLAVALAFGAVHLSPRALPALSTLGLVLGLCALRSGSLLPAVLVHALWNGSTFLLTRVLAG